MVSRNRAKENKNKYGTWDEKTELPTLHANNVIIVNNGAEFYILFGEVEPGVPPKFKKSQTVTPVARIALSPKIAIEMSRALNENIEGFLSKVDRQGDDDQ